MSNNTETINGSITKVVMQDEVQNVGEIVFLYDNLKLKEITDKVVKFSSWVDAFDYFFIGLEDATTGGVPLTVEQAKEVVLNMARNGNSYIPELFVYKYFPRTEEDQNRIHLDSFAHEMAGFFREAYYRFTAKLLITTLVKE